MFLANNLNKGGGAAATPDAQFNYVTMLLHGDGTNGAQNNTFLDSSTNNFSITRNGNTTQGSFSPYGSNWSVNLPASVVGGLQFDRLGTTSSFNFMHNASALWTLEVWVNLSALPASLFPIFSNNDVSSSGIGVTTYINSSGQVVLFITNGTPGSPVCSNTFTTTAISTNSWTHIALVYNQSLSSGNANLYINGVASGSANKTGNSPSASNASLAAELFSYATGGTSYAFNGYASNLRITNSAVYSSAFTPSTTPLTAIANTQLLTFQSNRFVDNSTNAYAIVPRTTQSIQRFNPFGTSTAYSTSVIGGSGYFDGSGDYLEAASNAAFNLPADFTFECWFNSSVAGPVNSLIMEIPVSGGLQIYTTASGTIQVSQYGVVGIASASYSMQQGAWTHLAVVRNGTASNNVTLYINGVSIATGSNNNNLSQGAFRLGGTSFYFNGYISNARLVKGTAVYTSNFTPPTAPLTAISGTSILCLTTNAGIFDNAMMSDLETVGNAQISTSVVKYGTGSIAFDGAGDWLATPASPSLAFGTAPFTLEAWVYPTTLSGTKPILESRSSASSPAGYAWLVNSSGYLNVYTNGGFLGASSSALTANVWTHVALVRTGTGTNQATYYINGVSAGTITMSGNFTDALTVETKVGGSTSSGEVWVGYIDDLRITNGYARYTTTFTPPTAAFSNTGPL